MIERQISGPRPWPRDQSRPLTMNSDSSNSFTTMLRYKLHFANMAHRFISREFNAPGFHPVVGSRIWAKTRLVFEQRLEKSTW
jgi:hypothetical protein